TLRTPAGATVVARDRTPRVAIRGPVGELALFVYGRQGAAQVELLGSDEGLATVTSASLGI
ncbi:MAG: TIGR03085 family protein, partial [Microthrixaceae bacterium]